MSGEMEPKLAVKVGDEILVFDPNHRRYVNGKKLPMEPWTETVTAVARVWITTDRGRRLRLDKQNEGLDYGHGGHFFRTTEQQEYLDRMRAAWAVLNANGLTGAGPGFGNLHDARLFAVAEFLSEFLIKEGV